MINDKRTMFYCVNNVGFSVLGMSKAPKFYWVLGLTELVLDITEVSYSMALKRVPFVYIEGLRSRNESGGTKYQRCL